MKDGSFLALCTWLATVLVVSTFRVAPQPDPLLVLPLDTAPDASVPEPPEPQGDCGSWDATEECET
jgi:hypothetical protein